MSCSRTFRQTIPKNDQIISPVEVHSKKPGETREKIVALMGNLPRVELIARQSPPGWDDTDVKICLTMFFHTPGPISAEGATPVFTPKGGDVPGPGGSCVGSFEDGTPGPFSSLLPEPGIPGPISFVPSAAS